jgi:hypothetical protein
MVTGDNPRVLIERLDRNPGLTQDRAHPPALDDFDVGQVCKNLGSGPFVRAGRLRKAAGDFPLMDLASFFPVAACTFRGS